MASTRISPAEFERACKMWATGNYTLEQLSEEFDLRSDWLSRKFKKAGVSKGQDLKIEREAKRRATEIMIADMAVELKKYTVDAQKLPLTGAVGVMRKALHLFQTTVEAGKSLESQNEEFKALLNLIKVLDQGELLARRVLQLDKEEAKEADLPVLEIIKMTEQDIEEERTRQKAEELAINGLQDSDDFSELPLLTDDSCGENDDDDDIEFEDEEDGTLTA